MNAAPERQRVMIMEENRIVNVCREISAYIKAINNAEEAFGQAERELMEELERRAGEEKA